ncbi:MAG TPA: glycosyltransferase family 39 protein [Blastocatellia bacterium]|nr:glycosyltransferase family 39 protein [Blastocatellia bacterium]
MEDRSLLQILKRNIDSCIFAMLVAGFIFLVGQRLGEVPVPQVDESYMMQTSYEMLTRGKLALPFRRFLGGDIENNWHSLTPVHYLIQTGFFKLFGWGIAQGRAFNLTLAMIVLLLVYLIGRKLFDGRVGLIAVVMIMCDVTFLERSHFLRNDYSAVMFALLAFYLYETAERRKDWRFFFGSGLAAGGALMCHTSTLYILAAIPLLMLARRGWRVVKAKGFYLFASGAFILSAYEIVSDIADWANFRLQYRGDKRHFRLLDTMGWIWNLRHEALRYRRWFAPDSMYADSPRTLTHVFQYLTIIAIAYLLVRVLLKARQPKLIEEASCRLLVVTATVVAFFALITSQKAVYYMAHLTPWFGLVVGLMIRDGLDLIRRLRTVEWKGSPLPKVAYFSALAAVLVLGGAFGYHAARLSKRYLRNVRNPETARFEEFKLAIRRVIPESVCPVEVKDPVMWLAFPEQHLCFAYIEERMLPNIDIDGKEYAMIVETRVANSWLEKVAANHNHLLGELNNTPYGDLQVYYTGTDPRLLALKPLRYQFFGKRRGFTSEAAVSQGREVWSAGATAIGQCAKLPNAVIGLEGLSVGEPGHSTRADRFIPLCSIELEPDSVHQLAIDTQAKPNQWSLLAIEEQTGVRLGQLSIGEKKQTANDSGQLDVFDGVFRTGKNNRVVIGVMPRSEIAGAPFYVSRLSVRRVPAEPDDPRR